MPRLEADWLLIADRGFYSFESWTGAAASGAALLWRVKADLMLPVLELLPDGSYSSVLFRPGLHDKARRMLIAAARAGEDLDAGKAVAVRVVEYSVPGRAGDGKDELIALVTTITDPRSGTGAGARGGLPPAVGARDRQRPDQDPPARPGPDPAVKEPGHGPPGDLRLPARPTTRSAP